MGARQSKRSVDISAVATKAEKGPAGEPLENGTITTASTDEKQVVEVNDEVEETLKQNGSTPHVDEKETVEIAPAVDEVKKSTHVEEEKSEAVVQVVETNSDLDTTVDESVKSPTDESATAEVPTSAEKKRKKKKSWSFRSISFSKKDKSKPTVKEQAVADVKTETVPEVAEEEVVVKEEGNPTSESAVEVPKAVEETPVAVDEKESASGTTNLTEIPPPLPSSPPPVETPAVSTPTIIETLAPVQPVVLTAPVQPVEPEVVQAEPEDDTVGGGEGLAEPPEGLNTSDIDKEVADVPLINGNHENHGNHEEYISDGSRKSFEVSPDDIKVLADKIEEMKLPKTADNVETTNELLNDVHETNGVCGDAIAVTNGENGHVGDN